MNSSLRNYLVIGLVVAAVALLTIVTQFSTTPPPSASPDGEGGKTPTAAGPPLLFNSAEVHFDPASENIAYRSFPGFFEIGDKVHWVSFWFRNPNTFPVRLAMRERSCTSCTSAKVAVVPTEFLRGYTAFAASAGLPWSPVPLPDLLSPVGFAAQQDKLAWHYFDFERKGDVFTVPAAESESRPVVGILALGFLAKAAGPPKAITATAEMTGR